LREKRRPAWRDVVLNVRALRRGASVYFLDPNGYTLEFIYFESGNVKREE
jgi:hypothetical protein